MSDPFATVRRMARRWLRGLSFVRSKPYLAMAVLAAAVTAASWAQADTVNFSQFGPEGTTFSSPLSGLTEGGVSVTLTSATGQFQTFTEGSGWIACFPPARHCCQVDSVLVPLF